MQKYKKITFLDANMKFICSKVLLLKNTQKNISFLKKM